MANTRSSFGALLCLAIVCLACLQSISAQDWSPRPNEDAGSLDPNSPVTGKPQGDRHRWDDKRPPNDHDDFGTSGQGERKESDPAMSMNSLIIIGVVVGCVLVCVLLTVVLLCVWLRRRRNNTDGPLKNQEQEVFSLPGNDTATDKRYAYTTMKENNSKTSPLPPPYSAPAEPLPTKTEDV